MAKRTPKRIADRFYPVTDSAAWRAAFCIALMADAQQEHEDLLMAQLAAQKSMLSHGLSDALAARCEALDEMDALMEDCKQAAAIEMMDA